MLGKECFDVRIDNDWLKMVRVGFTPADRDDTGNVQVPERREIVFFYPDTDHLSVNVTRGNVTVVLSREEVEELGRRMDAVRAWANGAEVQA